MKVKASRAGRKKSQFFRLTGTEVKDLYEDLVDPGPTNASTDDEYKCLNDHFHAEGNVSYERYVFRHMAPEVGETADKCTVHL